MTKDRRPRAVAVQVSIGGGVIRVRSTALLCTAAQIILHVRIAVILKEAWVIVQVLCKVLKTFFSTRTLLVPLPILDANSRDACKRRLVRSLALSLHQSFPMQVIVRHAFN